ncbi:MULTISPECIES: hypothetical protein [Pseudomonas]|uniref:hypothetical protein n=1 Tax=Pseudomonas TaxID=286 RepID=UPI0028E0D0AE|nr:hypothetical protein [Pseudomonas sp. JV245A]MDT9641299.1 hypothetical protein [Pseudomonas sp. JV245A]
MKKTLPAESRVVADLAGGWILVGLNVQSSAVALRRDHNDMWRMAERLEGIANRISNGYKK